MHRCFKPCTSLRYDEMRTMLRISVAYYALDVVSYDWGADMSSLFMSSLIRHSIYYPRFFWLLWCPRSIYSKINAWRQFYKRKNDRTLTCVLTDQSRSHLLQLPNAISCLLFFSLRQIIWPLTICLKRRSRTRFSDKFCWDLIVFKPSVQLNFHDVFQAHLKSDEKLYGYHLLLGTQL